MEKILLKFIVITIMLVPAIIISLIKNKKTLAIFLNAVLVVLYLAAINSTEELAIYLFNPVTIASIVGILGYTYVECSKKIKNIIYTNKSYNDLQSLNRDIEANYQPSIVAILANGTLDRRDLVADIMNLYDNKIIQVEKNQNQTYVISQRENANIEKLCESDKYIVNNLIRHNRKFDFKIWNNLVREQFKKLNFCKESKNITAKKQLLIGLLIVIVGAIIGAILFGKENTLVGVCLGSAVALILDVALLMFSCFTDSNKLKQSKLNENGKQELMKWIKFKNFISQYTLLNEKNIEDVVIFEKYIPFAMVLGVNKNYKDTIYALFDNNEIQKLLEDIDISGNVFNNLNM